MYAQPLGLRSVTRAALVRHDDGEYLLPEAVVSSEAELHNAFEHHPELFPTEELGLGQLLTVGREVPFESGFADLIYLDEAGRVVIVELKRGTENPDSRRVVAQLLDYGAHLWGSTYEDFEQLILPYLRATAATEVKPQTLAEAAAARLNLEEVGGPDAFAEAVRRNLADGTFVYAVVARTLPPTLGTVLRYLSTVSRLQTVAIAVDYFQDGQRRIMVPRVAFGSSTTVPAPRRVAGTAGGSASAAGKTTPEQFLEAVGPASAFWDGFIQYLDGLPGKFFWGSKGFSYRLVHEGRQYPVVWGYPRTVWWLQGKNRGDELRVLVRPEPDWPEVLRARVTDHTRVLLGLHGAAEQAEGAKTLAVFYVLHGLPADVEQTIRRVVQPLFVPATPAQPSQMDGAPRVQP